MIWKKVSFQVGTENNHITYTRWLVKDRQFHEKSTESVRCTITGLCLRMCHMPSACSLQQVTVPIQNFYQFHNVSVTINHAKVDVVVLRWCWSDHLHITSDKQQFVEDAVGMSRCSQ